MKKTKLLCMPGIACWMAMFLAIVTPVWAQQFTGTIQGVVRDASGAVIPGAEVSVTNTATNETRTLITDDHGAYVAPLLKPGLYRVSVKITGFKTSAVDGIKIDVQQTRPVDLRLDVGEVTETINVSASAAALEVSTSTVNQTIENKRIVDLPLNGRNPFSLATLSPGVIPSPGSSPWISGGRNATSEVTIDGVSNVGPENNVSILDLLYTPSVDAVQEFNVQTNVVSAEFGRLGGGVINVVTRSGSNDFHASLYEFLRNSALDANNFFSNRARIPLASFKRNQFGATAGGPMILPGLYRGRDRTFFFLDFEGQRQRAASVSTFTVPLDAWRRGDFSNLRNAQGNPIIIYDPLTTREVSPGRFGRDPLPGNTIPDSRINPVARAVMKFWPQPNTTPTNVNTQTNNYTAAGSAVSDFNKFDARVDHNIRQNWRVFVRGSAQWSESAPVNFFGNPGTPSGDGPSNSGNRSAAIDQTITLNPKLLLNVRYGFGRRFTNRRPFSAGYDFTQLGFPQSVKRAAEEQALEFPRFDTSGVSSLGQATFTDLDIIPMNHSFNVNLTRTTGRHTLKWGMEYRKLMINFLQLGQPSGQYSFDSRWTQQDPNAASGTAGFGMASLLLGIPTGGTLSHDPTPASASSYWAWYVQDDWKLTSRLTLNLGLRYELDVPRTERFDRLSIFRVNAASPIAGKVAGYPDLRGAMDFVTDKNRHQAPTDRNNFGPRFGFAYSVTDKTVVRGAYGVYFSASALQAAGHTGTAGMEGFRSSTPFITSLDGRTPINFLHNPFPDGFNFPTGKSLGAETFLGLGVSESVFLDDANPYIQQWNFNVQREMPGSMVFEVAYLGSKGTRLIDGESGVVLNQLRPELQTMGTRLQNLVINPFFGIITNTASTLSRSQVQQGQLLRPFPQYTGVTAFRKPHGFSIYHALTLRADKRFSHGLSFLASYTAGKLIDDVSQTVSFLGPAGNKQDAYNRRAERAISTQDVAQRLVLSYVYEFPFGKNKRFLNDTGWVSRWLLNGWQFNGITTFQSGTPLIITSGQNNAGIFSPGQRPNMSGSAKITEGTRSDRIAKWFDTSVFSFAPAFTFGTVPRTLPDMRTPGTRLWDLSLFKNNYFNEGRHNVQFRAEFFNAFNNVNLGAPGQTLSSGNFGVIGGAGAPRQIQLALKLLF
jgi:hypothetical protein